jgi:hypothetical protein
MAAAMEWMHYMLGRCGLRSKKSVSSIPHVYCPDLEATCNSGDVFLVREKVHTSSARGIDPGVLRGMALIQRGDYFQIQEKQLSGWTHVAIVMITEEGEKFVCEAGDDEIWLRPVGAWARDQMKKKNLVMVRHMDLNFFEREELEQNVRKLIDYLLSSAEREVIGTSPPKSTGAYFLYFNKIKEKLLAMKAAGALEKIQEPEGFELSCEIIAALKVPAADLSGKSDPYVTVRRNQEKCQQTRVCRSTLNPVWEQTFPIFPCNNQDRLIFEIWDYDAIGDDDMIARSALELSKVGMGMSYHELPIKNPVTGATVQGGMLKINLTVPMLGQPCINIEVEGAERLPRADANGKADPFVKVGRWLG